jgi:hypothetical protein
MCFGSGGQPQASPSAIKYPAQTAPPPVTIPPEETEAKTAERKRKQLAALKYGIGSTIKTSGQGDTGKVNLLLPALMGGGLKEKLGG